MKRHLDQQPQQPESNEEQAQQAEQPAPPQPAEQPSSAPAPTLAQEAEAFCVDLERFFRRAFGDLPKSSDLNELRAEQATIRDMVRRAADAGGGHADKLLALTAERDSLKTTLAQRDAALLQKTADFLNYQARTAKDLTRAEELALRRYMQDLLPVLDGLQLALRDAASPELDPKRLKDALELIDVSLNQALTVRGLERIVVEAGKPYDPSTHEAVALRPTNLDMGEKPNTILEELRAGYLWKGLVLRPAQVLVAEPDKQAKKAEPQQEAPPGA